MSAEWQKRLKTYREWLAERDSEVKPLEQSRRPKVSQNLIGREGV